MKGNNASENKQNSKEMHEMGQGAAVLKPNNAQEVMVSLGTFETRVVHTRKKHPQIGSINYQGKKQQVFIGFWMDNPVWKLVTGHFEKQEYKYCAQKTMPIEEDPDYCGEE
jgi:hypothetical protein